MHMKKIPIDSTFLVIIPPIMLNTIPMARDRIRPIFVDENPSKTLP